MADIIKFVYLEMEKMGTIFQESAQQLEDTISRLNTIATSLEQGVLLGTTGEVLASSIRQNLNASVNRLKLKFTEESADIQKAIDEMKTKDGTAGQAFNN